MKQTILLSLILTLFCSCAIIRKDKIVSGYYVPKNIEWLNPQSGIAEIDTRLLSSFPIYYFNNDSVFYRVSNTNELISDSIVYGVENSFKIERCVIRSGKDSKIFFEKSLTYSVFKTTKPSNSVIDTLVILKNNSFSISDEIFVQSKILTIKSKEHIRNIIADFGR